MENQITRRKHIFSVFLLLAILLCILPSESFAKKQKKSKDKKIETPPPAQLDKTIGDLAEVVAFNPIPVKGIGLVVGLPNTGSSECPTDIRNYLRQYILTQVGKKNSVNPDMMINNKDTAVVIVEGFIPKGAAKRQAFDVVVKTLANTQTTSLAGGRLYTTDLKFVARIEDVVQSSKTIALAAGPVYIDNLSDPKPDPRGGIVLGGGRSMQDYQITLALFKPDFKAIALIRNRINQRFGKDVASASSPELISLSIPRDFRDKKERFIELVKSLYITAAAVSEDEHTAWLIKNLQTAADKSKYQTALEAVGRPAADGLLPLLDAADDQTKFAAAKCLLVIGDYRALKTLRDYAQDTGSSFRIAAIQAIGDYASTNDVTALMNRLVNDENFDVKYNAYRYLRKYNDTSVIRTNISEDFYIDQVIASASAKTIYVSRSQEAGIVLFGAPVDCEKGIYVESDDGRIIINAQPTEDRLSVMRKHPLTGELMGPLKCSLRVADIIKLLGDEPAPEDKKKRPGLGVPYSDIIALLKKMVDKGAVKADFIAGKLSAR
ncbi:MAG: flagellar basal body P-ring protein FlgI [Phycisphaerae bacterium]|jgi:flagellar basal body P-ring protein FlgI